MEKFISAVKSWVFRNRVHFESEQKANADQIKVLQEHVSEMPVPLFPKQNTTVVGWSRAGDKDLLVTLEESTQFYQW